MIRTIINNKQVFQSYVLTTAKYDFPPYERRITYRLIGLTQEEIEGIKLKDNLRRIAPTDFSRKVTILVSDILKDEQDKHYIIAEATFRGLSKKHIEYENNKVWSYTPTIAAPRTKRNSGSVKLYVFDNIWRCLLDFTKGFKKHEFITAMKFKDAYTMRFYGLMSGQTKSLFVPLEGPGGLRERFYLQGKYEKVDDFCRKVIDIAKKEPDESSPYSSVIKEERAGKKAIGWTFSPVFYENREDPVLQEQAHMAKVTTRSQPENNVYDYLKFSLDSKSDEINKSKRTLIEERSRIPDFMGFLEELKKGVRLAENPKGYIIGTTKKKPEEI